MKVFITFSPQQERLSGFEYEPQENERLAYGKTCFPIIPAINGYAVPGEPFRVILVVQDYEFCQNNAAVFHQIIHRSDDFAHQVHNIWFPLHLYPDTPVLPAGHFHIFLCYEVTSCQAFFEITILLF